jgi:hypothetical protein
MKPRILIFMMMALAMVRCNDAETFMPDPVVFKASAFVEVKDLQGNPVEGALIKLGDFEGLTNEDGLLYVQKVDMNPSTYLTATKAGYFHGSRRFYPASDKTGFVTIVLMPEQLAGTLQADAGGNIQIPGGIQLDFPAGAIVDDAGQVFHGQVSVYAQPIAADDPDLSYKMPGDLVGLTEAGEENAMASFGMVVAELRSASGELLQIKNGSTVAMRIDIPSSLAATAPSTIPLWYFDEALGLWQEEGEAVRSGNTYVAQLPHFSYWNCDANFELVKWGATFVYEDGSTSSQVEVCLTILDLNTTRCAYTNADGFICGQVPAGEAMLMEVKSPCGDVIYSQQIGPYSDTTMIGPINIPTSNVSFTALSGLAVDCTGNPVTDGYARIKVGQQVYYAPLDETTGAFSISVMNCDESSVIIKIVDEGAFKESLQFTFAYAPLIDAGTITVCETITEYIDLEVVGFQDHYIFFFPDTYQQQGSTVMIGQDSSSQSKFFYVNVPGIVPGTYMPAPAEIGVQLPNGDRAYAIGNDVLVTITYYGAVGDYIIGTINGTWHTGPNGQGGQDYPLAGTFSILRE